MTSEFEVKIAATGEALITGNFKEMQAELATMMQAYAGLSVTEENLPERKKDVATLRKIKTAIEDKRKAAKKEYEKPLKQFEAECKKLTALIDKEVDRITADMNAYEQKRIAEKRETVKRLYDENIGEFAEYLPLESLRRPQWDNKTYTEKDIIFDIQESVIAVREDFRTIETMCEPWVAECKEVYKTSGLTAAFQRFKDLQKAKEVAEASVKASEQQAPTPEPMEQEKPVDTLVDGDRWVFTITVTNENDAKFIRDTCELFGYEYKEG